MIGLLLKDYYVLKRHTKVIFFFALFYLVFAPTSSNPFLFFGLPLLFASILPIMAFSSDESCRWSEFMLSLPIEQKEAIREKYLLTALCMGAGTAAPYFVFIFCTKLHFFAPPNAGFAFLPLLYAAVMLLIMSLLLPFFILCEQNRARLAASLALILPALPAILWQRGRGKGAIWLSEITVQNSWATRLTPLFLLFSLLALGLSCLFSEAWQARRMERGEKGQPNQNER